MASRLGKALYEELSVAVPWGRMAAKCWNTGGTRTVLGVHGWQDNANTFDGLIPLLPKNIKFIAIDLPGHGKSSNLPSGVMYEIQRYIMSLHFFAKGLNLDKFSLMAHSLGGSIAALYSGTFPDKIQQLVIIESICAISGTPKHLIDLFSDGMDSFVKENHRIAKPYADIEAAVARLKSINTSLTNDAARILVKRGTSKSADGYRFVRDPALQYNTLRLTLEMQLEIISRIKAHCLIILAEEGIILNESTLYENISALHEAYKKNSSSFKQIVVPGKHHLHLTNPTSISKYINDFLCTSNEKNSSKSKY